MWVRKSGAPPALKAGGGLAAWTCTARGGGAALVADAVIGPLLDMLPPADARLPPNLCRLEPAAIACFQLKPLPTPVADEDAGASSSAPVIDGPDDDRYRVWNLMHNVYAVHSGKWPINMERPPFPSSGGRAAAQPSDWVQYAGKLLNTDGLRKSLEGWKADAGTPKPVRDDIAALFQLLPQVRKQLEATEREMRERQRAELQAVANQKRHERALVTNAVDEKRWCAEYKQEEKELKKRAKELEPLKKGLSSVAMAAARESSMVAMRQARLSSGELLQRLDFMRSGDEAAAAQATAQANQARIQLASAKHDVQAAQAEMEAQKKAERDAARAKRKR